MIKKSSKVTVPANSGSNYESPDRELTQKEKEVLAEKEAEQILNKITEDVEYNIEAAINLVKLNHGKSLQKKRQ